MSSLHSQEYLSVTSFGKHAADISQGELQEHGAHGEYISDLLRCRSLSLQGHEQFKRAHLDRAISKLERFRGTTGGKPEMGELLKQLTGLIGQAAQAYPDRVASRVGDRVQFVELGKVSHFFAED